MTKKKKNRKFIISKSTSAAAIQKFKIEKKKIKMLSAWGKCTSMRMKIKKWKKNKIIKEFNDRIPKIMMMIIIIVIVISMMM